MSISTIQVPCGCVIEAEGEMAMVSYCPDCEAALSALQEHSCPDCDFQSEWPEELDAHIVAVHLEVALAPLTWVIRPVSDLRRAG